jgi:hypothetical protein
MTLTNTATNTPAFTPPYALTLSDTPTFTPTDTATNTPTDSPTPSDTPTFTPTNTATYTPTFTPTVTSTPVLPGAFNKSSPANNSTKQPTNPILKWSASTGATSYQYCYDTINNNVCDTSWVSTASTNVTLSNLRNNMIYYWQARAVNPGGITYANAGAWWNFKVVLALPILISPGNGATHVGSRPHFAWSDPNAFGVTGYTVQISKNNTFTSLVITSNVITNTFTPSANLPVGTLYWRVEVNGPNGPSLWSTYFYFSTP